MTSPKKATKQPRKKLSSSQSKVKKKEEYIKRNREEKNTTKRNKRKKSNNTIATKKKQQHKGKAKKVVKPLPKKQQQRKKKNNQKRRKKKQLKLLLKQLALTIAISAALFSMIIYFTIRTPKMEGYAMTTALTNNDRVLVSKMSELKRFKMVYFKHPQTKEKTIRRIIGMPGEELYYKNDQLFINNKLTPERFLEKSAAEAKQSGFLLTQDFSLKQVTNEERIPEGKYFVMGDNRQFSSDSRDYGLIDEKDIIGVVELRVFPLNAAAHF
ncbi:MULTISPECIES: signal peptidase I [unclassified Enterococcus]|uniref:signal peptidase I n=1 Tax=unclassified Enterococcus TaxID=2608891 RepID=UPI001CE0319E|nr:MULTISPECIES: signal peptidase I [unclassified Enterococcus]MCA5012185.1 signal peptidase I [Enterococcus sp. S23]MCA5015436.1 signal peptidase I [Enterococcus sp. S22(2020)]